MTPRVSVVMAVHNGGAYLREAIESILAQTWRDFEYIIIDDASTDDSREVINTYRKADARIRLISNPSNLGLTRSLNVGLKNSLGEYVARQDADDVSLPNRLRRQVEWLDTNSSIGLLGTGYHVIDTQGEVIATERLPCSDVVLRWTSLFHNPLCHTSVMARRVLLNSVGGYDEQWRYGQDYELWTRMLDVSRVGNLNAVLVSYRSHPHAVSAQQARMQQNAADIIAARQIGRLLQREIDIATAQHLRALVHGRLLPDHLPARDAALELLKEIFVAFCSRHDPQPDERAAMPGFALLQNAFSVVEVSRSPLSFLRRQLDRLKRPALRSWH